MQLVFAIVADDLDLVYRREPLDPLNHDFLIDQDRVDPALGRYEVLMEVQRTRIGASGRWSRQNLLLSESFPSGRSLERDKPMVCQLEAKAS